MSERNPDSGQQFTTNTTHLMWLGRWVEVKAASAGWTFKTGRDAADYLLWPRRARG